MSYAPHDLLGNVGVAMILIAYLLVQLDRLEARSLRYSIVNAAGAALVVLSLSFDFNLSAFIVESAWCLISLYGAARTLAQRRITSSPPTP